ncbi:TetR/AcrR family transcriptional regulator [Corynebacterium striatum]|uniref:TetR/AcrR family transcriptional regulator n=1 Tax=Corynebacterium striatum TaxID=43770 RepID=UPI003B592E78
MSLREQKRLETRLRIEDAATSLVDKRGFSATTIEEICEHAGISRRTFFNYFDSKDSAVLGSPSEMFSDNQRTYFLKTSTEDLLHLTVELVKNHMHGHHANHEIAARRRRIAGDPDAAAASFSRKRAKSTEIAELIKLRLEKNPELSLCPDVLPETEALLIGAIVREALWIATASPEINCATPFEDRLDDALKLVINFSKGLKW